MFVMINASDNPWMVALLVFVQVIVPLLQSNAADDDGDVFMSILLMLLLAVPMLFFFKYYGVIRAMFLMRGQHPNLTWREFIREANARELRRREASASAAAQAAAAPSAEEAFDRIMHTIQAMPMEEFMTPDELRETSIHELKDRLKRRDVDYAGCVERNELVDLLVTFRGGPSNNDTCCICCEEYQSGDIMRLLRRCKHEFHLECLDKWAFTSVNAERKPVCPLCNQSLD
ncbi:hypothetical protein Poli38472_006169 [Pythium oligandrum]|uniref:RING-type E3 ubiquitin transferase n=1 Tax=Pythium oligandrum TaxID=41045 RepID=A0A8K1FMW2_PYTOL|nr:hypothetical protein Poli38472_006169 [Pythium oligandrum]|eukprot:TMW68701.1 hypothetical protein Poli38472_006169 [Pythium oligandrum]